MSRVKTAPLAIKDSRARPSLVGPAQRWASRSRSTAKIKDRFGIAKVVLVGDRGMLTAARLREDVGPAPPAALPASARGRSG